MFSKWFAGAALALALAGCATYQQGEAAGGDLSPIVRTDAGPIRGVVKDGVQQFLGIPYAVPPMGALRWKPPRAAARWNQPRDATVFGNTCAQNTPREGFAATSNHEDCLFLNVYAPARAGAKRPVMVWVHGGGLFMGSGNDYDPRLLVTDGDVVFVSMNYRLNVFGFFSHPAINSEGDPAGNYGLMDQQLALRWVQSNIQAFGGDPGNITLFGESGGGISVWAQLASPAAAGLFQKAIVQSGTGTPTAMTPSLRTHEAAGRGLAQAAGCDNQQADCLRSLPVEAIMAATVPVAGVQGNAPVAGVTGVPRFLVGLMADGTVLPAPAVELFSSGRFHRVPIINGTNRDEHMWFQALTALGTGRTLNAADYPGRLAAVFGPALAPRVLALYPLNQYPSADNALAAAIGDRGFICDGNRRANRMVKRFVPDVYAYEFDVPDTPIAWPPVPFPYRSAHTAEVQYIFPLFRGASGTPHPLSDTQIALSRQMIRYWTTFARTGTPNARGPVSDSPRWTPYESGPDNYLAFRTPVPSMRTRFGGEHNCDFWDGVDATTLSK